MTRDPHLSVQWSVVNRLCGPLLLHWPCSIFDKPVWGALSSYSPSYVIFSRWLSESLTRNFWWRKISWYCDFLALLPIPSHSLPSKWPCPLALRPLPTRITAPAHLPVTFWPCIWPCSFSPHKSRATPSHRYKCAKSGFIIPITWGPHKQLSLIIALSLSVFSRVLRDPTPRFVVLSVHWSVRPLVHPSDIGPSVGLSVYGVLKCYWNAKCVLVMMETTQKMQKKLLFRTYAIFHARTILFSQHHACKLFP